MRELHLSGNRLGARAFWDLFLTVSMLASAPKGPGSGEAVYPIVEHDSWSSSWSGGPRCHGATASPHHLCGRTTTYVTPLRIVMYGQRTAPHVRKTCAIRNIFRALEGDLEVEGELGEPAGELGEHGMVARQTDDLFCSDFLHAAVQEISTQKLMADAVPDGSVGHPTRFRCVPSGWSLRAHGGDVRNALYYRVQGDPHTTAIPDLQSRYPAVHLVDAWVGHGVSSEEQLSGGAAGGGGESKQTIETTTGRWSVGALFDEKVGGKQFFFKISELLARWRRVMLDGDRGLSSREARYPENCLFRPQQSSSPSSFGDSPPARALGRRWSFRRRNSYVRNDFRVVPKA